MYEGEWREGINIRITSGIPCIEDEVIEHYKEIYNKKEEKDNTIHIENSNKEKDNKDKTEKENSIIIHIEKDNKEISINQHEENTIPRQSIVIDTKEGWLQKESRYRKVWRNRWCVLDSNTFCTYENENKEFVEVNKRRFIFEAQTIQEKNEWLNVLKSKMNNNS